MLVSSLIGMVLGITALPFYTLGLFTDAVAADLGWSRTMVQSGISAQMIMTVLIVGAYGVMVDKLGVRKIVLFSQIGLGGVFFLLSQQNGSLIMWQATWALLALVGLGTSPLSWSRGIVDWFVKGRGFALGIALSGSGVTAFVAPHILNPIIAEHGWRAGYMTLAALLLFVALPVSWFLFHPKAAADKAADGPVVEQVGLTLGEAVRGYRFWLIMLCFALISFAVSGLMPNLVPILTEAKVQDAVYYASLVGIAILLSRLATGFLIDHFWAPGVAFVLMLIAAVACYTLSQGVAPGFSTVALGVAAGAEFDLIAFMCARYFGTKYYGRIYSWQWAGFALATAAGTPGIAWLLDHKGYGTTLAICGVSVLSAGFLLLLMGRYPDLAPTETGAAGKS